MTILPKNAYYVCVGSGRESIFWNPYEMDDSLISSKPDLVYFGKVFQELDKHFPGRGFTFYLTWDTQWLPSYGSKVVVVLLGDEWCRIPSYLCKVGVVFKAYGTQRILGCNPIFYPSYLNWVTLIHFAYSHVKKISSSSSLFLDSVKSLFSKSIFAPIYSIPLGYFNQIDLPVQSINQRPFDVYFAGSITQKAYSKSSLKYWIGEPKSISRMLMIENVQRIKNAYPDININISLTNGFESSANSDSLSYSEALMSSKICLVPRGTSFETFRYFEAMRYGCIVITELLPSRWFYDGSPAIQIKDWNQLESILVSLLTNKQLMEEKHLQSLNWWETKCSEKVLGKFMVEQLLCLVCDNNT